MAHALRRIVRFRQLAEEQARLEVERAAQLARQASAACEEQTAIEHEQRWTLAKSWTRLESPSSKGDGKTAADSTLDPQREVEGKAWLMEEAVLEFSGWKLMRLEKVREAELRRIEPMIELYTERRRELRQTEQLLEQQARTDAMERDRREQARTDEWFLQRTLMRRRGTPGRFQERGKETIPDEDPPREK